MSKTAKPPCAASMGCLCAGHARGNNPDAPCDTREAMPDGADVQARLSEVRNELLAIRETGFTVMRGEVMALSRMLDSIAETAVRMRGDLEHGGNHARAARLVTKVRKALGYTVP